MTVDEACSGVREGCFPPVTADLYEILPERPGLSADQRAAALTLDLYRHPLSFAKRLGFRLAAGDSVARLFYLHRMALRSETGLKVDRADFWWDQVRWQWERLPVGHAEWDSMSSRLAAETGTALLADPRPLRATILREVLVRTHVALANGLAVATPRGLASRRADEHLGRAAALIDAEVEDEAGRKELRAEVERLRVAGLVAGQEWDRALRIVGRPESTWESGTLPALLLIAAGESARAGRWSDALRFADLLGSQANPTGERARSDEPPSGATARPLAGSCNDVNLYRIGMYLRAIRSAVSAGDWPAAVRDAVAFARAFPRQQGHSKRIADLSLRAFSWAEMRGKWDDAVRFAGQAAKALPTGVAELRTLTTRLQRAGTPATPADSQGHAQPAPALDNLRKTDYLGKLVQVLEELISDRPWAFPAFNALASLLLVRAAHLSDGNRPAQGLYEIARARAYFPGWQQVDNIEPLIMRKLEALKTAGGQWLQKLSPRVRQQCQGLSIDELERGALSLLMVPELAQAEAGTGPRDRFLASVQPESIRQRRVRARSLWLWRLAQLPIDGDSPSDGRLAAFAEAYDLLLARGINDYDDMVRKWDEVRAGRPDLPLAEVTAQHLVTLIVNDQPVPETSEVPNALEPGDQQLDAVEARLLAEYNDPALHIRAESLPRLPLAGTLPEARGPDEPFAFWWFSRRGGSAKLALAAGIGLVAVSAALWWCELASRPRRDRAFSELREAVSHRDGTSARQAVSRFRSAMTLPWVDPRIAGVEHVGREVATWRPSLHERDSAYERLVSEARGRDESAVVRAAEAFLAIDPDAPDPRRKQVRELLTTLRERADRRARDAAYGRLTSAVERGDESGVLEASEQFLEALTAGQDDPRREQVHDWYSAAFARWFVRHGGQAAPEIAARVDRYKSLVLSP